MPKPAIENRCLQRLERKRGRERKRGKEKGDGKKKGTGLVSAGRLGLAFGIWSASYYAQAEASVAGVTYHAINRGNARLTSFHKPEDYDAFIRIMDEGLEKYQVELFAFTLMPNYWHLVLRPGKD